MVAAWDSGRAVLKLSVNNSAAALRIPIELPTTCEAVQARVADAIAPPQAFTLHSTGDLQDPLNINVIFKALIKA